MTQLRIAGVDEVGRGPLAGPVVAAAVVLDAEIEGVADSKTLRPAVRERLAVLIRERAQVAVAATSVAEIARLNIRNAALLAMRRAVLRLATPVDLVLVDGDAVPPIDLPCRAVIGGDASVPAIGAASIVAKVLRDRLMARLALRWPGYAWERNAGYPTREHRDALSRLGPTPHHRMGFAPLLGLAATSRRDGSMSGRNG